ncbi:ATP-binding cassette domain-containing protein [Bacillus thuringiensis]|nr:ATP-binding cassette domain-containing protein [Bacillus thuringiensis]
MGMHIEMKNISKAFNGNPVLKNAQFMIETGEVHALMGENGAGKSTLMKILTGVYKKMVGQSRSMGKSAPLKMRKKLKSTASHLYIKN